MKPKTKNSSKSWGEALDIYYDFIDHLPAKELERYCVMQIAQWEEEHKQKLKYI